MRVMALGTALGLCAVTVVGCASIIKGRDQALRFASEPAGARMVITDLVKGTEVHSGETPFTTSLKRGQGYFKASKYRVTVERPGFQPQELIVEGRVNGWYFGNFAFGGLVGLLVVDPLTGAMWKLEPEELNVTLRKAAAETEPGDALTLVVTTLDQVPLEAQLRMQRVHP